MSPATAIVLAAGRGSRLGGPKALLCWPRRGVAVGAGWHLLGEEDLAPLAVAHAQARLGGDCHQVLIVTRQDIADQLADWLAAHPIPEQDRLRLVISTAPEDQKAAGSLNAAVRHLGDELVDELFVITPVDCPPAGEPVVRELLSPLGRQPGLLATRPLVGQRRGHPVVLRGELLAAFAAPDPPPLRDLLRRHKGRVADIAVEDPAVLLNLNTAAQLAAFSDGAAPRFYGSCKPRSGDAPHR